MLDIQAFQCCECSYILNPIVDSNVSWHSTPRIDESCCNPATYYDSQGEPHPCNHIRCDNCVDLDLSGRQLRYCDGKPLSVSGRLGLPAIEFAVPIPTSRVSRPMRVALRETVRKAKAKAERRIRRVVARELARSREAGRSDRGGDADPNLDASISNLDSDSNPGPESDPDSNLEDYQPRRRKNSDSYR